MSTKNNSPSGENSGSQSGLSSDPVAYKEYSTVGEAASILGVSIDTVRRWEKRGLIKAERLDGKNRYFDIAELEAFKAGQQLSTTEVAKELGISASSVRRLEAQGLLIPQRDAQGLRMYAHDAVATYKAGELPTPVESAYVAPSLVDASPSDIDAVIDEPAIAIDPPSLVMADSVEAGPTISAPAPPHHSKSVKTAKAHPRGVITRLQALRWWQKTTLWTVLLLITLIFFFMILFLVAPSVAAKLLGYDSVTDKNGTHYVVSRKPSLFAQAMGPITGPALSAATAVDPSLNKTVQKVSAGDQFFTQNTDGTIRPKYVVSLPNSSFFNVPDQGLVVNLNSEYVDGYKPGNGTGNLAVIPVDGNLIQNKSVTGSQIADGTIQLSNLSASAISSLKGSSSSSSGGGGTYVSGGQGPAGPTGPQGPSGPTGAQGATGLQGPQGPASTQNIVVGQGLSGGGSGSTVFIGVQAGNSTSVSSGSIEVKLATGGTSSTTSSASGLEVTNSGVSLIRGCSTGQTLAWNGSGWACASGGGGGSVNVQASDGSVSATNISNLNFGPTVNSSNEFNVINTGGGNVRVQLGTNVLLTTNYATTLDSVYVNTSEAPLSGDIVGSFGSGLQIAAGAVQLGNDTTGNYVAGVTAANGITATGTGAGATVSLALNLATSGTTSTVGSTSGLEIDTNGALRLAGGCTTNQILKWNGIGWACSDDASASLDISRNGTTVTTGATSIDYSTDFTVSNSVTQANIGIDYASSGITRSGSNQTIVGNWSFNDSSFSLQDNTDSTKKVDFALSGLTTGTTRTLNVPDVNGTLITTGNLGSITTVGTVTSGTWQGTAVGVQYGGTGATTLASNGLLYGNGTGTVQTTTAGTGGQLLIASALGVPTFASLSGDATLAANGSLTLADTAVATGTYGDATHVGQFTVDSKGRIVTASAVVISGVAPSGAAGGDLTGSYPNPTIAKLQNSTLTITAPASGNYLAYNGSAFVNQSFSGDLTVSGAGVSTIATNAITTSKIADGNVTNAKLANSSLTVTAGTGLSGGGSVSLGGSSTGLSVIYGSALSTAAQGNTALTFNGTGNLTGSLSGTAGGGFTTTTLGLVNNPSFTTSVTSPLFTNAGTTLSSTGAANDLTLSSGRNIVLNGFNCSAFTNGGVLTTDASGNVVCQNDDGGAAGSITGTGTTNRLSFFSGTSSLADSWLLQNTNNLQLDTGKNLELISGSIVSGGSTVLTSARVLQNVTTDASIVTSGSFGVARGGTGLTSYTTGDLVYANSSTTLASLVDTAAGNALISGGAGAAPTYGKIVLGTHTSGAYVASVAAGTGTTTGGTASNPTVNVTYGSGASTAAQGNTALTFNGSGNFTGSLSGTAGGGFTTTTLAVVSNPTFTGLITSSANSAGLALTGTPAASATTSLVQVGSAIAGGNASANGGTYLGLNAPVSGAGSAADFLNFQLNSVQKLKIDNTGLIDTASGLAVGGTTILTSGRALQNLTGLTVTSGGANITGGLTAAGTITLSGLNTAGVVHTNGSGVLSTSTVVLGTDTSGAYVASVGAGTGTTTGGTATNPTVNVTYGSTASTAAQGNTAFTFTPGGNFTGSLSGTAGAGFTTTTLAVSATPSFTSLTATGSTTGLIASGAPTNAGNSSLVQLGSAIAGGNTAANGGTYLGLNAPASGAGSAADLLNFQVNGAYKLKVSNSGLIDTVGGLAVGGTTVITSGSVLQNVTANASIITAGSFGVSQGGTGITTYATGDLLYASGVGTLSKLALGLTGQCLQAGASAPIWTGCASGSLFSLAASIGTTQSVNGGATVSILAGASGNITTTAAAGPQVTIDISASPSFATSVTSPLHTSTGNLSLTAGGSGVLNVNTSASTTANTGNVTIQSGNATSGANLSAGIVSIDTGSKTGSGSAVLNLGNTNAATLNIGNTSTAINLSGNGTITRTAAGSTTLDLLDAGADTTFILMNSNATKVANFNVADGELQLGGTSVISKTRVLQNVTTDASIVTTGSFGVTRGGTGLTSYTIGDLLVASAGTTLASLPDAAINNVLLSGGAGAAPTYGKVTLGVHTTGAYVASVSAGTGTTTGGTATNPTVNVTYGSGPGTAAQGNTAFTFTPGGNFTGSLSGTAGAGFTTTTLAVSATPSFTSVTSTNGNGAFIANGTFSASTTVPLAQLGGALTGGSANGTYLGINQGVSGTADFLNFQVNGSQKLKVDSTGSITAGTYNGATISSTSFNTATISGGTLSGGSVTGGSLSASAVNGLNVSSTALSVVAAATNITLDAGTTGKIQIGATSTGDIELGGGSASTGCTVTNSTGALACSSTLNGATISGGTLSAGTFSGGSVTGGTLTSSAVNSLLVSGTAITGTSALAITSGGTAQNISIDGSTTGQVLLGGSSTGDILLGGGSASTGCTVTNATGALACSSTLNGATITSTTFNTATISGGSLSSSAVNGLSVSGGTISSATFSGTLTGSGSPTITGFGTINGSTLSSTAVNGLTFSGTAITGSGALAIASGGTNTGLTLDANGTGTINIGSISTGDILIGGGAASTGCTLTNSTGDLACTGGLTVATSGSINGLSINAGALSGISTITTSGAINGQTISSAASFTGTVSAATGFKTGAATGLTLTACATSQYIGNGVKVTGGLITAGSCQADATGVSDVRLKKDIVSIGSVLDRIKDVNVDTYYFQCDNPDFSSLGLPCEKQTGIIAQEIAGLFPDAVTLGSDGYYRVDFKTLNFYTLKAVSELAKMIDSQGNAKLNTVTINDLSAGLVMSDVVATNYPMAEQVSAGDVVALDATGAVRKATSPFQHGLLGTVVSTSNGKVAVATAGKVATSVNGPVAVGDLLTSSSVPGVAQVANGSGPIIGLATTAFSGTGQGSVVMAVQNSQAGGGSGSSQALQDQVNNLSSNVDQIKAGLVGADGQPINFGNLQVGAVHISMDTIADGGLTVGGAAEFKGTALFDQLVTFGAPVDFNNDVKFNGNTSFNNNAGGYAVINAGRTVVHVGFGKPYAQAPVISLTSGDNTGASYHYENVTATGFDIVLNSVSTSDAHISWLALSINGANTFVQQ
jgi:excisionase family DNA binding protein